MKRKLLTAVTLLAAVMTLGSISSPIEVYAISANNGGGGGGSAHASSDYRAWSRWHQGYRFYMINKDLERVSP